MALHGQIQVNGQVIGGWSAVRRDEPAKSGEYVYDCDVQMLPYGQRPATRETFAVSHSFAAGAVALAAKVLAQASV